MIMTTIMIHTTMKTMTTTTPTTSMITTTTTITSTTTTMTTITVTMTTTTTTTTHMMIMTTTIMITTHMTHTVPTITIMEPITTPCTVITTRVVTIAGQSIWEETWVTSLPKLEVPSWTTSGTLSTPTKMVVTQLVLAIPTWIAMEMDKPCVASTSFQHPMMA